MSHICKLRTHHGDIIGIGNSRRNAVANAQQNLTASTVVLGRTTKPARQEERHE